MAFTFVVIVSTQEYGSTPGSTQLHTCTLQTSSVLVEEKLKTVFLFGCSSGLARKQDFPYITYYCPHCHALNRPKQLEEHVSSSSSPSMNPLKSEGTGDAIKNSSGSMSEGVVTSNSPVTSGSEIEEVTEKFQKEVTSNSPVRSGSEIEEVTEKIVSSNLVG